MSGGQITGIIIVAIVMIASVVRAMVGGDRHRRRGRYGAEERPAGDDAETMRLREEVKNLKARLAVIERITVEKENSLAREIEQLRDEPRR
jgi:hypothetical protein